jgi:signal peptidase I
MRKRRNIPDAVCASIIIPGFGQLYNGSVKKSLLIVFLIFFLKSAFWYVVAHVDSKYGMVFWFFVSLFALVYVFSIFDAGYTASRIGVDYELKKYNNSLSYITFILLCLGLWSVNQIYTSQWGDAYKIPSNSMLPTLSPGDRVVSLKKHYEVENIQKNDMVTFVIQSGHMFVGRIIALPTESVSSKNDVAVPEGYVYIDIDNKNYKRGPYYGLVPQEFITGKVILKIWSLNFDLGAIK